MSSRSSPLGKYLSLAHCIVAVSIDLDSADGSRLTIASLKRWKMALTTVEGGPRVSSGEACGGSRC